MYVKIWHYLHHKNSSAQLIMIKIYEYPIVVCASQLSYSFNSTRHQRFISIKPKLPGVHTNTRLQYPED